MSSGEAENVAQRVTEALLEYANEGQTRESLDKLLGQIVAAVAELDARTAHVQR